MAAYLKSAHGCTCALFVCIFSNQHTIRLPLKPSVTQVTVADCGDSIRSPGEACDDGNIADYDGCSRYCTIELGWSCAAPITMMQFPTPNLSDTADICGKQPSGIESTSVVEIQTLALISSLVNFSPH